MFLLDTNIWLERMLGQEQSATVGKLLDTLDVDEICLTDFTVHSIGVICSRLNQKDVFRSFVQDVLIGGAILTVSLPPEAMLQVDEAMSTFGLDFDDAYQYIAARREQATIVSFDKDFDKTPQERQTPNQVLAQRKLD